MHLYSDEQLRELEGKTSLGWMGASPSLLTHTQREGAPIRQRAIEKNVTSVMGGGEQLRGVNVNADLSWVW